MTIKNKLMQGNEACVEGALAAGMKFYAGYPITPSTEIAELSSEKLPKVGGKFLQMEDEIAGITAAIGASLAGLKSMTATSGPGFSLKQEVIGYASIAEIPCVVVDVQRGGPSTGLPTSPSQSDIMQARWGTHGDHSIIALYPNSVKEIYTETIRAFNLAEKYRTPVIFLMDEVIGHMRERINIDEDYPVVDRKKPTVGKDEYLPYKADEDLIPPMAAFGEGYKFHVTGLVHDETGFPKNDKKIAEKALNRLIDKIELNKEDILSNEEYMLDDAEHVVLAYGCTSRSAKEAVDIMRREGIKVGMFRPITIWPSPDKRIEELAKKVKSINVIEMNMGQYFLEVDRIANKHTEVRSYTRMNGELIEPQEIITYVKEVAK